MTRLPEQFSDPKGSNSFQPIVSVLLVIIIGLLAILWHREHTRRLQAEREAAVANQKLQSLTGAMSDLLFPLAEPAQSRPAETESSE
jgi:cytoskeletal protein RodZ